MESLDDLQTSFRPIGHGHRDRPVQIHDRGARELYELRVQRGDPGPICLSMPGRGRMYGGDRGLDLIRPRTLPREQLFDEPPSLLDLPRVPPGAVLVLEQHSIAVVVDPSFP